MSTITDSYQFTVPVTQHGIATIQQPVVYPSTVEKNTPFDISYTIKNTGAVSDNLYGHLLVSGLEVTGSYWTQNVAVNATVTKTYTCSGIAANTTFILECGHL